MGPSTDAAQHEVARGTRLRCQPESGTDLGEVLRQRGRGSRDVDGTEVECHLRHLVEVVVLLRHRGPDRGVDACCGQEARHLGCVHPCQEVRVRCRVAPAIRGGSVHPGVDTADPVDHGSGFRPGSERRGSEERRSPLEAPERVVPVDGMLGHSGHGQGVEHLEEECREPADEHGGQVAVDPSDDGVGGDVGDRRVEAGRRRVLRHAQGSAHLDERLAADGLDPEVGHRLADGACLSDLRPGVHRVDPTGRPGASVGAGVPMCGARRLSACAAGRHG